MPYESETMVDLKAPLHRYWASPQVPEAIERLVRRFINCRKGLLWRANWLLQDIERTWSAVRAEDSSELEFGAFPAIEALAFVVAGLRNDAHGWNRPEDGEPEPYDPNDFV